jgi:hypothetical protein
MAARAGIPKERAELGSIVLAIHDFVARSTDELSLAKGDRIELVETDDEFGDGWFLGRHMGNNKTGLFPEGMRKESAGRVGTADTSRFQYIPRPHPKVPSRTPLADAAMGLLRHPRAMVAPAQWPWPCSKLLLPSALPVQQTRKRPHPRQWR